MPGRTTILTALALAAAAAGPGSAATRSFPATGFDKVDLAAAADVVVHTGAGFSVRADGEQAGLDRLNITVRQGTLVIGWKAGTQNIRLRDTLRVSVTMPRIVSASISGAGKMRVDRVAVPTFVANVGGAGSLALPAVRARSTALSVSGAGSITAVGGTDRLVTRVSGVGSIDAAALAGRDGRITVSGTGSVRARVDGPVDVVLSGMGDVRVLGRARCAVHKSGLGEVRCGA